MKENQIVAILIGLFILGTFGYMAVYQTPFDSTGGSDCEQYDGLALNLISGKGFVLDRRPDMILGKYNYDEIYEKPTAWRVPGYPLFLAPIYWLSDIINIHRHTLAYSFQIILCALMFLMLYKISRKFFDEKTSQLFLLLLTIFPAYAIFSTQLMAEILGCFLLVSIVYILLFKQGLSWHGFAGALFTLSVLTRVPFIFFLPILILVLSIKSSKYFFVFLVMFMVGFTPWIFRNQLTFNESILFSTQSGEGLYWQTFPYDREWKSQGGLNPELYPEYYELAKSNITESELSSILGKKAFERILNNPISFIKIKLDALWQSVRQPYKLNMFDNEQFDTYTSNVRYVGFLLKRGGIGWYIAKYGYWLFWISAWLFGTIFMANNIKKKEYWPFFLLAYFPIFLGFVVPMQDRVLIPFFPFILMFACGYIYENWNNRRWLKRSNNSKPS